MVRAGVVFSSGGNCTDCSKDFNTKSFIIFLSVICGIILFLAWCACCSYCMFNDNKDDDNEDNNEDLERPELLDVN